jgi:hypothetical protein
VVRESNGHHPHVVAVGVVPVLLRDFDSFHEREIESSFGIIQKLSYETNHQHYLLISGVLSVFQSHRLQLLKVSESQHHLLS